MPSTMNGSVKTKPPTPETHAEDCLWIDVRTPAEFREIHIPGSRNVPLGDLEQFLPELKSQAGGKHIGLVCASGRRAGAAFEQLAKAGIDNCWVLEGGVTAWARSGGDVNRGRKAISLERQVRMVVGAMAVAGSALGAFMDPWFFALSAAAGAGLFYSGVTDSCAMAFMLSKLPYNRSDPKAGCCTQ